MIIWLASYPKSGNTWLRFFILSLLFGNKDSEIINKISLPEFLAKQLLAQARNFTSLEVQNIYRELAELDLPIKYQSSLAHLILKDLFQRICSGNFKKKVS